MTTTLRKIALTAGTGAIAATTWFAPAHAEATATADATASGRPAATGTVRVDDLAVRRAPTTHSAKVVTVDRGASFTIRCQVAGADVGDNPTWLAIGPDVGKWVAAKYVRVRGVVPLCNEGSTTRGVVAAEPVLNSFTGPSLADESLSEYQPGAKVRVRCQVANRRSSGDTTWLLTDRDEWLTASYVTLRRGADVPVC